MMRSATHEERTFVPPCFYLCPTFPTRSRLPDSLLRGTPQQHAKPSSLHCLHERESTHRPSMILPSLLLSLTDNACGGHSSTCFLISSFVAPFMFTHGRDCGSNTLGSPRQQASQCSHFSESHRTVSPSFVYSRFAMAIPSPVDTPTSSRWTPPPQALHFLHPSRLAPIGCQLEELPRLAAA